MSIFTAEKSLVLANWPVVLVSLLLASYYIFWRRRQLHTTADTTPDNSIITDDDVVLDNAEPHVDDDGDDSADELPSHLESKPHIPYAGATRTLLADDSATDAAATAAAQRIYHILNDRRSVRSFHPHRPLPAGVLERCIHAAGTSPSGAHTEPWTFCVVRSATIKRRIRDIVEREERLNYAQRMAAQWRADLRPLRTDAHKPYLTDAPALVLLFKQTYGERPVADGRPRRQQHYYHEISVAMAAGLLLAALQCAGLSALVTTPLNCGPALRSLLDRPANEKLLVLLPVGYAADGCAVPDIERKRLDEILVEY